MREGSMRRIEVVMLVLGTHRPWRGCIRGEAVREGSVNLRIRLAVCYASAAVGLWR